MIEKEIDFCEKEIRRISQSQYNKLVGASNGNPVLYDEDVAVLEKAGYIKDGKITFEGQCVLKMDSRQLVNTMPRLSKIKRI